MHDIISQTPWGTSTSNTIGIFCKGRGLVQGYCLLNVWLSCPGAYLLLVTGTLYHFQYTQMHFIIIVIIIIHTHDGPNSWLQAPDSHQEVRNASMHLSNIHMHSKKNVFNYSSYLPMASVLLIEIVDKKREPADKQWNPPATVYFGLHYMSKKQCVSNTRKLWFNVAKSSIGYSVLL